MFLSMLSHPDGKVVYKLPSQVAVCEDAVIRNVIRADELERHLSLSYLHPGLRNATPTSLLTHLGVRFLRGSDVSTVTTAMAKELMRVEGIHSGVCSQCVWMGQRGRNLMKVSHTVSNYGRSQWIITAYWIQHVWVKKESDNTAAQMH